MHIEPKLRRLSALVLALATITVLAACGSSSSASSDGVKTVKIALVSNNKPYTYADANGQPAGYDVDVLKKIDAKLPNYKFEYTVIDYETGLIGTKSGKYDIAAGCYFRTDARAQQYLISKPYNYYFLSLIVKPGSPIKTMTDLNGKSLYPIDASDGRYAAFKDWVAKHPDVKIDMTPSSSQATYADMAKAVHDGTYDAVYLSKEQFSGVQDSLGFKMEVTAPVDGRDTVYLFNKKDAQLQQQVDGVIETLTKDGTLTTLTEQYFGQDNFALAKKLGIER
ncbi:transporter substrate-binding domain-containing protein [Acidipropionibacterium jensenii]|uniref:transporter substrate-binding domain-containing protein n=1 Tax=Acidipropionibacterium jensenii TaxID=1749 RepID=UPI00214C823A|nr:transporter substrate-binding domain-containing protein [Acidipropionibacterium jensenii]